MQSILIVEDEKRVADLLKAGLEENGYSVMVAYDGEMGLRLFRSNEFHLVISDIVLPPKVFYCRIRPCLLLTAQPIKKPIFSYLII